MSSSDSSHVLISPRYASFAFSVLLISHLVGAIGLNAPGYNQIFENLAAINLLLSFVLVIIFQKPVNLNFILFCAIAFAAGMAAEICGVNSGLPFGVYHYTSKLGISLAGVPLIIGLNWVLLSYVCGIVAKDYTNGRWQRILAASLLMVAIDLLLEGFAIKHGFWLWETQSPPISNFISWLLISMGIQWVFYKLVPVSVNKTAFRYLFVLFIFLLADRVALWLH